MMQSANKTHVPVCPNFKPNYNHRERRKRTPLLGPKRAILSSREFHSESTGVERGPVPVPRRHLCSSVLGCGKKRQREEKVLKVKPSALELLRK